MNELYFCGTFLCTRRGFGVLSAFKDLKGLKVERLCANYRLSGDDVFGVFPLTAESANLIFWP